jgi:hypothetical protein
MSKKKPYSFVSVKNVELGRHLAELAGKDVWVGIDVSKEHLAVVLCWGQNCFTRPWKVRYPDELGLLVQMLLKLWEGRRLTVAIEPTGPMATRCVTP